VNGDSPDSVVIRLATPRDRQVIERLRASVGWSMLETGLSSMQQGRSIIYILEVNDMPAASGALVLNGEDEDLAEGRSRALISNLIVDPRFQSRGFGTELLGFLEEQARQRHFNTVTIGVDASNVRARKLYERHGYRDLKTKEEPWGLVYYLAKPLAKSGQPTSGQR